MFWASGQGKTPSLGVTLEIVLEEFNFGLDAESEGPGGSDFSEDQLSHMLKAENDSIRSPFPS